MLKTNDVESDARLHRHMVANAGEVEAVCRRTLRKGSPVALPPRPVPSTSLASPVQPPVSRVTRSRGPWRVRRRVALLVMVAVLVPLFALGLHGWRVIEAIGDVQRSAVVPLPSRVPRETARMGNGLTPIPEESDVASRGENPEQSVGGARTSGRQVPLSGTLEDAPDQRVAAQTSMPTPTVEVSAAAAVPTAGTESDANPPSSMDVLREVVQAGTDRGDPGRDEAWGGRTGLNILVLGIDRRAGGGDQNADVIILARVDLVTKRVSGVSIPRDLLVEIPGYGQDKINSAYNHGVRAHPDDPAAGVALMRDTVENAFGVPVDDYVLVDFAGFEAAVDAVGGIDITLPEAIRDETYPSTDNKTEVVEFPAGRQHMTGEQALKYARIRNPDSDDQRRERQFQVLMALFEKGQGIGSVRRASEIILALGDSIQTSFPLEEQLVLARVAFVTERSHIHLKTIEQPMVQPGYTEDGAWVYVGEPAELRAFVQKQLDLPEGS